MVRNKRGRKPQNLYGTANLFVKTYAKIDGEWIYIGMSKKVTAGVTTDGEYTYFTTFGKEMKQAV